MKQKADVDDFNEIISQIFKILSKQASYQGKLDTNSLFQLQANPNQLLIQFMQFTQNNHDNSQGIQALNNQGKIEQTINNNPTPEEIIKILDKILESKAESEEEKQLLEDVQKAKNELKKGNILGAKELVQKVWGKLQDPSFQFALGLGVNATYDILKAWLKIGI